MIRPKVINVEIGVRLGYCNTGLGKVPVIYRDAVYNTIRDDNLRESVVSNRNIYTSLKKSHHVA
jgi:hypothetical protein